MTKFSLLFILLLLALTGLLIWQFPYALEDTDQKGNMLYTLLLLILLSSSGLVHYRGRMGELAKHSALWLLILLVLVTGYSYRHELSNNRIISSLLPKRAIIGENGTMIFRAAEEGHFYIEARVNGVKINFMVDTGASDISLSPRDAERLGFDVKGLDYSKTYYTANGVVKGAPVILDQLIIGTVTVEKMPASVNAAALDKSLLGMSFFQRLHGFSVQGDTLTLTP
jgi:aspartyl protease family protein